MDIVKEITETIVKKSLTLETVRMIQEREGVDLEEAALIAQNRIEAAVFARVNDDDFLTFTERPGVDGDNEVWAKEYEAAAKGYKAGYIDGFIDRTKLC